MTEKNHIVTRFAPSPTGLLHVGVYRTGIFSYLHTKKHGGKFILRIEDTDKERNKDEYAENILESLAWIGLHHDELYYQSKRADRHEFYLKKLIDEGKAYISKEEPKKEGGRTEVIRFKNPNTKVFFNDLIRGHIEFDTTELKDFVIAKSLTEPLFHLAVVVDDFEMGVTDVIRGEDHISNTPRQILIQEAIGAPTPRYAHLPLVLSSDRTKLSKRKGALSLTEYRDRGYLKEALLNYIALVGWNPGTEQEIFTEEKLVKAFDVSKVHKGGAIFDEVKLQWVNKEHMKKMSEGDFKEEVEKRLPDSLRASPSYTERIDKVLPTIKDRISYFGEIEDMVTHEELGYFFNSPTFNKDILIPPSKMMKGIETSPDDIQSILSQTRALLGSIEDKEWSKERIKEILWPYAEEKGKGTVLWPLRVALSGKEKSADPFTIAEIIGKPETLKRIDDAI